MSLGQKLTAAVSMAKEQLLQHFDDHSSARFPAADKWSPKQIIGHLIDSASNNHQRFARANFQDDLIFPGYQQDAWVGLHGYQDMPWEDLLELWSRYNYLLARLIDRIPEEILKKMHSNHSFDRIAWKRIPADQPANLEYFIEDYIGHLEHHIKQII